MKATTQRTLPQGWQWKKFGDCAQFINGRAYSQHELLDSGTPVLRIQNLNGGDRWYYSNLNLPEDKYCEAGDLLYAWSASFGPYRFSGPKSIFHYHIWRVIPGAELDKDFTFHLLEEITAEVKSAAHGVAMLHMTKGGIEAWPIPLPPLAEQRRIAEVLDRAEALRAKRRAALAELDSLTQSLFLDLFGDPVTNPQGWPVITLGDALVATRNGANAEQGTEPGGWPITRIETIADGTINPHRVRWIEPDDSLIEGFQLQPGDILFSHINSVEHIAKTALYSGYPTPLIHGINLLRLRPKLDSVEPVWLLHFLKHDVVRTHFRTRCKRAVNQASLNQPDIKSLEMYSPPIALQQEFARQVGEVEKLKQAQRAALAEQDALFATLQHRAFRGEL